MALLSFMGGVASADAATDRGAKWRGACCSKPTEKPTEGGKTRKICKDPHIDNPCCVERTRICEHECDRDFEGEDEVEGCKEGCQASGLACLEEGPIPD